MPTVEYFVMRKAIASALLAMAFVSGWIAYSKVTHARRESAYRAAMAPFQRDLRMGMDRTAVKKYLDSQKVDYHTVRNGGSNADIYFFGLKFRQLGLGGICKKRMVGTRRLELLTSTLSILRSTT
jgi:hypothetical protein